MKMSPRVIFNTSCLLILCSAPFSAAWLRELKPHRLFLRDDLKPVSFPQNTSPDENFRILLSDGDSVIVGGRDAVYNISTSDLTERENQRIEWEPSDTDKLKCTWKGGDKRHCHNFIRIFGKISENRTIVCGTNSYDPKCRTYVTTKDLKFVQDGRDQSARGIAPFHPDHNSTFTVSAGELYTGTAANSDATESLIYRAPLLTNLKDLKQLNEPEFVGSIDYGDFVYFFFRETAVENINCGKALFSRVARVCKKDKGSSLNSRSWTSFLKARLNCSVPGKYPFHFDLIHSMVSVRSSAFSADGSLEQVIYATFTTHPNSIPGSAVCAFRMSDITAAFKGPFKQQSNYENNWLPVAAQDVPSPRPGVCVNDSRQLSVPHVHFILKHPLMDLPAAPATGRPLLVSTSEEHMFSSIAVQTQVAAVDGSLYDILYIATDRGRVLKSVVVLSESDKLQQPTHRGPVVEELQLFPPPAAQTAAGGQIVNDLLVSPAAGQLLVVSNTQLLAVPLARCSYPRAAASTASCRGCVALRDPHCSWDVVRRRCSWLSDPSIHPETVTNSFLQNITHGVHALCDTLDQSTREATKKEEEEGSTTSTCNCTEVDKSRTADTRMPRSSSVFTTPAPTVKVSKGLTASPWTSVTKLAASTGRVVYTAQTLTTSVLTSCLLALLLGFVGGWMASALLGTSCRKAAGRCSLSRNLYPRTTTGDLPQPPSNQIKDISADSDAAVVKIHPDDKWNDTSSKASTFYVAIGAKDINLIADKTKNDVVKNINSAPDVTPPQKVRKMYL